MDRWTELNAELGELTIKAEELSGEISRITELDDPTEGELARADRQMTALNKVDERIKEIKGEQRELVRSAVTRGRTEGGSGPDAMRRGPELMRKVEPYAELEAVRSKHLAPVEVVGRAKAAVDDAPEHLDDTGREHITRLLQTGGAGKRDRALIARHMLLTGSPEYHEAFEEYAAGRAMLWSDAQREAVRMAQGELSVARAALSLTDAQGGYLVPFTLDPTILLTNTGVVDPIRMLATIKQTATDTWNGVTSAGVSAEWTAEGAVWADASPGFAQPTITPKKADAWVFGSYEVLSDSGFASQLGMLIADAKARLEAAAFAVANTGATIPRGIVAAVQAVTASIVTAGSATTLAITDVYRADNAVTPRGEEGQVWVANKAIYNLVRQFDTSGGSAFWSNLEGGVPPLLLGSPAYKCSSMTGVIGTNNPVLLTGNIRDAYYIVDRVGMVVIHDPLVKDTSTGRPTGQAGYACYWRVGADVVNVDALRVLKMQTTAAAVALA